jgi:hypothetical protein
MVLVSRRIEENMKTARFGWVAALALTVLLFPTRAAQADPLTFSFALEPVAGTILGEPGSTIGWGYVLGNGTDAWLELAGLDSGTFEHGMPDAGLFDYPILAPHSTRFVTFNALVSGLFQLTWDIDAPTGFTNSGLFVLSANFYDGDPLIGGAFLSSANEFAAYSASVSTPTPAPVPEPATLLLTSTGIALLWRRRRASMIAVQHKDS